MKRKKAKKAKRAKKVVDKCIALLLITCRPDPFITETARAFTFSSCYCSRAQGNGIVRELKD
jgi:hypothetical protein